ncbi:MAG: pyridoxal-phosphate dependent enzyme [Nitriliruptorales bacterium]|nr:pyridoxal-phosphate dependent enzyme [Nitriliruptorales bacterium]
MLQPVRGFDAELPSPVEELHDAALARHDVRLLLKRDDLIHPEIPGNKWRKLKYNLAAAREEGHSTLLTFGGAYSNHLRAVAAVGHSFGFNTIGAVRGEDHAPLNWSLGFATSRGMRLTYLDRSTYRRKRDPEVIATLQQQFGPFFLVPEGGSNALAVQGCAELPPEIDTGFDVICCACGTGGTLAGIASGLHEQQRAIGFSALKGGQFLAGEVAKLQRQAFGSTSGNWRIEYDFSFGGFAKRNPELDRFIQEFKDRHGLSLDWVYVAKMLYGVFALVEGGQFEPGTAIVAVITGPADCAPTP